MDRYKRQVVEALKKTPFLRITFKYGYENAVIDKSDKLLKHDVAIAVQSYFNRLEKQENAR